MKRGVQRVIKRAVTATSGPAGPHVTRYVMYRRLAEVGQQLSPKPGERALSVSGSTALCATMGLDLTEMAEANYPDATIFDLPYPDATFDYVVSDQVLEHVEGDPFDAVRETLRVLQPGGVLVHATCFVNPRHWGPGDYWRFSPDALRLLIGDAGDVLECDGWGNRWVWVIEALGLRYAPVPESRWHPLHRAATRNNPDWPVSTWIVARKRR